MHLLRHLKSNQSQNSNVRLTHSVKHLELKSQNSNWIYPTHREILLPKNVSRDCRWPLKSWKHFKMCPFNVPILVTKRTPNNYYILLGNAMTLAFTIYFARSLMTTADNFRLNSKSLSNFAEWIAKTKLWSLDLVIPSAKVLDQS